MKQNVPRPLVVVPGILGSLLTKIEEDGTKTVLWNEDVPIFKKSRMRAAFDIPIEDWEMKTQKIESQISRRLKIIPLVYSFDHYDTFLKNLEANGYENNVNLFIFSYDWREPIPETAEKLREFLNRLSNSFKEIDLYGDSQGSVVSLEALVHRPSSLRIKNLILTSSPILGSPIPQRIFLLPRRSGFKMSAIIAPEDALHIRSLYYMLPERRLHKIEKKNSKDIDYSYDTSLGDKISLAPWMDENLQKQIPPLSSKGLHEAYLFREKWSQKVTFPSVESALVVGAECEKTFGSPGDGVVLAESVAYAAQILNTEAHWICAPHNKIPNHKDFLKVFWEKIFNTKIN